MYSNQYAVTGPRQIKQENLNKFLWEMWVVVDQSPVMHLLSKGKHGNLKKQIKV